MKIVVYGASGSVGTAFDRRMSSDHDLLAVDLMPPENADRRFITGDVRHPDLFHETLVGADASVYLPFVPYDPGKDPCNAASGASFDVNLRGIFYWLAASREHGVDRLVFASSLSVFGDIHGRGDLNEAMPATPRDIYGLTKTFAEETCRYFVRKYAMDIVVLRLCGVLDHEWWINFGANVQKERAKDLAAGRGWCGGPYTHIDDVAEAIRLAIVRSFSGFHLFHVFGEQDVCDWPTDALREELGFTPRYPTLGDG